MATPLAVSDQQQVIAQVDTIIHELEALRRQLELATMSKTTGTTGIIEELFGAAGQGTRDEYDEELFAPTRVKSPFRDTTQSTQGDLAT